jgi:hypothetical protein
VGSLRKSPFEKGGLRGIFNQVIQAWWNPFSAPSNKKALGPPPESISEKIFLDMGRGII